MNKQELIYRNPPIIVYIWFTYLLIFFDLHVYDVARLDSVKDFPVLFITFIIYEFGIKALIIYWIIMTSLLKQTIGGSNFSTFKIQYREEEVTTDN